MKISKPVIGVVALLIVTLVSSQQDPQYTQYTYNMNILNPAYAGSTGYTSLGLLGRSQWIGVDGAPKTFTLSLHSPIGFATGIGLSIIHDEIGPIKENNVYVDYSYAIRLSEIGNLAFGLKAGSTFLTVMKLDGIDLNDSILNEPIINKIYPNIGAGIYYYTDFFYLGFSASNIVKTRLVKNNTHYFLTSGYVFDIGYNLKLKPSMMLKSVSGARTSIDLSTNIILNNIFEIGLSYRVYDSVSTFIGFQIKNKFKIGYAYDFTTSHLGDFNYGSHEIILKFNFEGIFVGHKTNCCTKKDF